jgi:type II secretory pathway component GspD/PulD (secretin)
VAEPRTNSLIVTGSARRSAPGAAHRAARRPQRQVNVQVRIQEITRSARAFDLGIDWGAGFGNMTSQILSGGLSFIFDTTQVISSLNVLAVLDTLETQGLTRRVDDSNITVLDNGTGTIQSGGTIFISLPGASENIERTIPYGVQIDVTPRIAADGRITLDVEAKRRGRALDHERPDLPEPLDAQREHHRHRSSPARRCCSAACCRTRSRSHAQQIPMLGSIPLIGDLFGRTVTEEDSVDLLIILTAQIID